MFGTVGIVPWLTMYKRKLLNSPSINIASPFSVLRQCKTVETLICYFDDIVKCVCNIYDLILRGYFTVFVREYSNIVGMLVV